MRVLTPWTSGPPRNPPSSDVSLPLCYYAVMRGWHAPVLDEVLATGWSDAMSAVATALDGSRVQSTISLLGQMASTDPSRLLERSKPYQASLLHLAVYARSPPLVSRLLQIGLEIGVDPVKSADGSLKGDHDGLTPRAVDFFGRAPLTYAACADAADLLHLLLGSQAAVDARDTAGRTALHVACAMGHTASIRCLLSAGANMCMHMCMHVHMHTCMHMTCAHAHVTYTCTCASIRCLLSAGAKPTASDEHLNTAMHFAAQEAREQVRTRRVPPLQTPTLRAPPTLCLQPCQPKASSRY